MSGSAEQRQQRELSLLALFRVHKWLAGIRTALDAIRSDPKQPKSVLTIALHCSITADRLRELLKDTTADTTHGAQFVAQAIELAAKLADEWHSLNAHVMFEAPLSRYLASTGTGNANTAMSNANKKAVADQKAIATFDAWKNDPSRRAVLAKVSRPDQLKKYLKIGRPADRVARRLRAMLKDGRIIK